MSQYYLIDQGKLYAFPTAQSLKTWVERSRELQTFPTECGAKFLGTPLYTENLSINVIDQLSEHEELWATVQKMKAAPKKKQRYRNSR